MSVPTAKVAAVGFAATLILMGTLSFAQSAPPKPTPMDGLMNQLIRAEGKLGPNAKHISGALRNAFGVAHHWESLKAGVSQAANAPSTAPTLSVRPLASSTVTTRNLASRIVGFTQSENPASNTDHFQPAVSSDQSGRVAVCFYDRRNDPNNFYIDRYCANSTNGGGSFGTNTRITTKSSLSVVNQDLQLGGNNYMGDYDTLASDTMSSTKGFRGGFGDNLTGAPNIQENKF